jgi:hypothetical protein
MVEVITTETGVPAFIEDGTLVPLSTGMLSNVVFLEVTNPGSLDRAMEAMKAAIMVIAGIDPTLPDDEWAADSVGDSGSFTLTGLPAGGQVGKEYGWLVYVYNAPTSYGLSHYYRRITFLAGSGTGLDRAADGFRGR